MSYILDALKKADAERERGGVPGLHAQPAAMAPDDDEPTARAPLALWWIGAGAALCLIAVLSWQLLSREPAAPPADGQAATVVPAQPAHSAHSAQLERPLMANMPPPAQTPVETVRPTAGLANRSRSVARTPERSSERPPASASPQAANADDASKAGSPATTASPQRIPALQELPDDIRSQIPQLTIGGAMYSETPSSRMLIINNQVYHEGDKPYQGLTLQAIGLRSAVFSYREHRYSINY